MKRYKCGVNGMPDFVGLKKDILYLIEVKDIKEKIFKKQHDWLNWNINKIEILITHCVFGKIKFY